MILTQNKEVNEYLTYDVLTLLRCLRPTITNEPMLLHQLPSTIDFHKNVISLN